MAKGYWIVRADIHDMAAYKAYVEADGEAFEKYGGRFLARGGVFVGKEGSCRSRQVVIEFADYATALACYDSPEYQRAKAFRDGAAQFDLVIAEGV